MSNRSHPRLLGVLAGAALGWVMVAATPAASAQDAQGAKLEQMMAMERQDFGVPPSQELHSGAMHGPTPARLPGGQVITTKSLLALVQGRQAPFILFDVLGQPDMLPDAVPAAWLAQAGTFDDAVQQQARQLFGQRTHGRKDVALVFYCQSRECWMSYNAALRAVHAGYTNVLWYRGGIEAWKFAGLPTQPGQAGNGSVEPPSSKAAQQRAPAQAKFVPVQPLAPGATGAANGARPPGELRVGQGRHFSFALPPGWRVGEDAQYALTLVAPDNQAMTVMVGNSGFPLNYPVKRFAFEKLSSLQPQNLQIGEARQVRPVAGFRQAVEFDVSFQGQRGVSYRGVAKVSVAPAYDTATMAMTAAYAAADQWAGYASWLPQVADQVSATNGAAFGMRGVMQQNLQNSVAYGEAARQYRDWSQKNWQGVTDARNASQDRRNFAVRENLGGVQTFANPYGGSPAVEMPMTNKYYWADRQGRFVGTDDPSADPNTGSSGEWRRMERVVK